MKDKIITLLMVVALLLAIMPAVSAADRPYVMWLQGASVGKQSWAYYPFVPAHPWSGGKWSAPNTGTSGFAVWPGFAIARKVVVHCDLPPWDQVTVKVIGLPSSWVVKFNSAMPISTRSLRLGMGYTSFYVIVPANATAGTYSYSITARSGTGLTSKIMDTIVVAKPPPKNLLLNPGFEMSMESWNNISLNIPELGPGGIAKTTSNDSHDGMQSLMLDCGDGSQDYQHHQPYAAVFQPIDVQQSDKVRLTFWSKGDAFKVFFGTFDDPFSPWAAVDVPGSADWTYHTLTWDYNGYPESQYFQYGIIPYASPSHKVFIDDLNATISN